MEKKIETRKTEQRIVTSNLMEMFGKYVARNISRKWTEDFVDEETGDIVSIDRQEILIPAGTYIDQKVQSEINFFIQSGDIQEVEVSNQSRLANESKLGYMGAWFAVIETGDGKKHKIILHANCIESAIDVLKDYVELNFAGYFKILQLKTFDNCVTLTDSLIKLEITDEGIKEDEEERKINKKFYKITMNVDQEGIQFPMLFIVYGKDVENSIALIDNHISKMFQERAEKDGVEIPAYKTSLETVVPMPCSAIVEKDFCLAYADE